MRAVQIDRFGGPEVLRLVDIAPPSPPPGHTLIKVSLAGVNYDDIHQTENTAGLPATLPKVPGAEVVGTTEDGRRVVALVVEGGYAEYAVAADHLMFPVPDDLTDGQALALMLQGTAAWHLLRTAAKLRGGESVAVPAAAGGVGSIAVQLACGFGAGWIIGTASTAAKRELVTQLGADVAIDSRPDGLRERLIAANGGQKIEVVLEMTGGAVFLESLRAVAPFGRLVTYGQASRQSPVEIDPAKLIRRSRAVVGFWLPDCFERPKMLGSALSELIGLTASGLLRPIVGREYPLSEAARAHTEMMDQRTIGKIVLNPAG